MKLMAAVLLFSFLGFKAQAACTLAITVNDPISAATLDYFERAQKRAHDENCDSVFVRMNTPGGNLQTTRMIVENILASPIPYLCLITPTGGHAGSAGAIILQACHVNGGLSATNIGAATPISAGGDKIPDDLRKKLINDTVSWMAGVTKLRGRNLKFSEEIITEARALTSEEAHEQKALDILSTTEVDFIKQAEGRKTLLNEEKETVVKTGDLKEFNPDLRYKVLSFIADPEFAYLLFMGSLGLLYVEITHPGLIAPGVIGGIGLIFSMIAFHKLNVTLGGLALILLGIGFLIAEIFVPSFGILGVGGLIAVFVGSVFLYDTAATGYSLPLPMVFAVVGTLAVFFLSVGFIALKTLRLKRQDSDADLKEAEGKVVKISENTHSGQIHIMGETWNFVSEDPMQVGDRVHVTSRDGLTLTVKKNI